MKKRSLTGASDYGPSISDGIPSALLSSSASPPELTTIALLCVGLLGLAVAALQRVALPDTIFIQMAFEDLKL